MSFADKVVIVTGASSGIGAGIAIAFAKEKANVVIVGRNETKLSKVTEECRKIGTEPLVVKADITYEDQVEAIIKQTIEKFGKLDVLVNNAGFVKFAHLMNEDLLPAFDDVIKTNVRGQVHVTNLALEHLIKTKGNIINISSVAATRPIKLDGFLAYNMSKAALNQFTKCAALELAQYGVRVNSLSPGPVQTDFLENAGTSYDMESISTPLGKISSSKEVADLTLFLASDKGKSITGVDYIIDNGYILV